MDILLVDDNQDCLELVKKVLENKGMTVHCVENGEIALCELRENTFYLMITDLSLPGLDGFALAQKALKIAPGMPVIMITGEKSPGITRLAEEIGIVKVLFKPFYPNEMLTTVREAVEIGRKAGSRPK